MLAELKKLSSHELVGRISKLVKQERNLTTEILWHLKAIETKCIYAELGYGSMYEFTTKHLQYSEGAAHRRISAARLLQEVPEMEASLQEGKLTLTTAALAQGFFKPEGKVYSHEAKKELLRSLEGKSRLQAEKELASRSPEILKKPEKIRAINATESEMKIVISDSLKEKLEKIKGLIAHQNPNPTWAELLEYLADRELKRIDPMEKRAATSPGEVGEAKGRKIPASTKRQVWQSAQGQCEYRDPKSKLRCASKYALQIDHIQPWGLNGNSELENLRLLCANHNRLAAIQSYGGNKMRRYLKLE